MAVINAGKKLGIPAGFSIKETPIKEVKKEKDEKLDEKITIKEKVIADIKEESKKVDVRTDYFNEKLLKNVLKKQKGAELKKRSDGKEK